MILVIVTILLFGIAELSYIAIEKPFLNLGHRFKYDKPPVPVPA
jgi:hypothetical protein